MVRSGPGRFVVAPLRSVVVRCGD